ncbi:MAG: hypothetical protein IPL33_20630 [Sphingobacteriales bacterium]|nr:hypothetical protein [Sphingobacteriales bacterium]
MLRRASPLCASDWESSHNRRQRPHSRRMPCAREILPESHARPLMRVMDGCVLLAVVFALMRSNFTCYGGLNRFT